jgi:hypothetical protein
MTGRYFLMGRIELLLDAEEVERLAEDVLGRMQELLNVGLIVPRLLKVGQVVEIAQVAPGTVYELLYAEEDPIPIYLARKLLWMAHVELFERLEHHVSARRSKSSRRSGRRPVKRLTRPARRQMFRSSQSPSVQAGRGPGGGPGFFVVRRHNEPWEDRPGPRTHHHPLWLRLSRIPVVVFSDSIQRDP